MKKVSGRREKERDRLDCDEEGVSRLSLNDDAESVVGNTDSRQRAHDKHMAEAERHNEQYLTLSEQSV